MTYNMVNPVNYNLILFSEFAIVQTETCAELMRKAYQLGRPYIIYIVKTVGTVISLRDLHGIRDIGVRDTEVYL